jgi:cytochrome d ubiquinol oxidase subunit I
MAYEVLTAFFLEAGFLGVMLFGRRKVGPVCTCLQPRWSHSARSFRTWIVSANSWMHTPAGFAINAKGQFVPAGSWWPIIFNPSFPYRSCIQSSAPISRRHWWSVRLVLASATRHR